MRVRRWARSASLVLGLVASAVVLSGCSGDDSGSGVPLVVVPNDVLADIVERVGCVGDVDVVVGPLDGDQDRVPAIELVLTSDDSGDAAEASDDTFVVAIPDVVSTIDRTDGTIDSAIWMDPARLASLVPAISGALVAGAGLDAELTDRCVARVLSQIQQLDVAIAERLAALDAADRIIDIADPGVAYFAGRYDLAGSTGPLAVEAGDALTVHTLGDADSYDEMMLANADSVVAVFR